MAAFLGDEAGHDQLRQSQFQTWPETDQIRSWLI